MDENLIRIPPFHYVHVMDSNTNLTTVVEGPLSYIIRDHLKLTSGKSPMPMIQIPPRSYCIIKNPVIVKNGSIVEDSFGMAKVRYSDREVRTSSSHPNPFPLYPFEQLETGITKIPIIKPNHAYLLKALRDFTDSSSTTRSAGDEWLFHGPGSYIPSIECEVVKEVFPFTIRPGCSIKIRALRATKDYEDIERKAGEEWLIRRPGDYLCEVAEEIVEEVKAIVLTERKSLHLRAIKEFTDVYGKDRKAGEEWLLTLDDTDTHIPDVYEIVVGTVNAAVLNSRQYCYVLDPVGKDGKNKFGEKKLMQGECNFFLRPFENLEKGIQEIIILADDEALLLKAIDILEDKKTGKKHVPGEKWMIYGPCDYIPPVQVNIIERRKLIPLDENEGIYVRDTRTGEVKAHSGKSYMLKPEEVLWELNLPAEVEELVVRQITGETFQIAFNPTRQQLYWFLYIARMLPTSFLQNVILINSFLDTILKAAINVHFIKNFLPKICIFK